MPVQRANERSLFYHFLKTDFGHLGLVWTDLGLRSVLFPHPKLKTVQNQVRQKYPGAREKKPPVWLKQIARILTLQLKTVGAPSAKQSPIDVFPVERLDFSEIAPFHRLVYVEAMKTGQGQTTSYSELAKKVGSPRAARAVGQAMARNPLPLIVPCHRVLAAGGKLGGFTAPGGTLTKKRLLEIERQLHSRSSFEDAEFDPMKARRHLMKSDARLAKVIRQVEKKFATFSIDTADLKLKKSPYEWLLRSIIFQQLNGRAASTIHDRVRLLFAERDPSPEELLGMDETRLRSAGLSQNKLLALRDLAEKARLGLVLSREQMKQMSNEDIIQTLLPIRGIGRWTIEMLLLFGLGRSDVLAVDDFALKKATMQIHGLKSMPNRVLFQNLGEKWRPYRSVASWYLWRSLDL